MFIKQSMPGACGVAAVANFCRLHGVDATERDVVAAMDREPNLARGVDETVLALALMRLGFRATARFDAHRNACIASVDKGDHWIVIADANRSGVRVIDSSADAPLETRIPRSALMQRWQYRGVCYSLCGRKAA